MKRRILAVVGLVILVSASVLIWRGWSGSDERAASRVFSGYVEADYVFLTSAVGGVLTELNVARGDHVPSGARLFLLDEEAERGARDQAAGQLRQAEAQAADLLTGRRPAELDAIRAQQAEAQAALKFSEAAFQRQVNLNKSGVSTKQLLDNARSQRDRDQARVRELAAQLRVARLPGRDEAIRAADAGVLAARGALQQAEYRLSQKTGIAPAAGTVVDTLYRPGELVQAGLPVVQLLPPENIKIRFFVPERIVSRVSSGQSVQIECDGCGAPIDAIVRYISPRAEFTPPVIYSREQRSRLVFMVEARPTEHLERLRVGQPVDVTMALRP